MPAKTSYGINDSAATPTGAPVETSRTYTPGGMEGNVHTFYNDDTGASAQGRSKLTASLSMPTPNRDTARVKYALSLPFTATVDGVEETQHTGRAYAEFVIPAGASVDERKDLKSIFINALSHSDIGGLVADLEDLW